MIDKHCGSFGTRGREKEALRHALELLVHELHLRPVFGSDLLEHRADKLLGYFSFVPRLDHPLLGSCAGINIILLPEIQGAGLGWTAYAHLIAKMDELGIEILSGRTSNPAVIHISTRLGRRVHRYILRRDGPFIPAASIPAV